jgi:hypothetical protein
MDSWHLLEDGVNLYRDTCNVYAVRGADGQWLSINTGIGRAAACLSGLGEVRDVAVLLAHHLRDHTAEKGMFRRRNARVFAPCWERAHLSGSHHAFRAREHWLRYDLAWNHFAPIKPFAMARWMERHAESIHGTNTGTPPALGWGRLTHRGRTLCARRPTP